MRQQPQLTQMRTQIGIDGCLGRAEILLFARAGANARKVRVHKSNVGHQDTKLEHPRRWHSQHGRHIHQPGLQQLPPVRVQQAQLFECHHQRWLHLTTHHLHLLLFQSRCTLNQVLHLAHGQLPLQRRVQTRRLHRSDVRGSIQPEVDERGREGGHARSADRVLDQRLQYCECMLTLELESSLRLSLMCDGATRN